MKRIVILLCTVACLLSAACAKGESEPAPAPQETAWTAAEPVPTAAPAPTAAPDPSRDAALLANSRLLGGVTEEHALAVLRFLDGQDQPEGSGRMDYLAWLLEEGRQVYFYREIPFENGVLVTAMEPFDGEVDADLFYVADGAVQARAWGADCWSIDIARFMGHTIVFGGNFAYETDTTGITAVFFDGTEVSDTLSGSKADSAGNEGFILVADGQKDLQTLTIYNDKTPVADQEELLFALGCANYAWAGTPRNIFYVTHLCPMQREVPDWTPEAVLDGAPLGVYDWEFQRYAKNEADWRTSDAWRTNNGLYSGTEVRGGETLTFKQLPEHVTDVYLAYPSRDDGTDAGAVAAVTQLTLSGNAVTLPDLTGEIEVRLVIETADSANTLMLTVQ